MYTDTADYGEWKFGRRATGLIMAASLFALKLGLTLGGAIIGWVLAANDFVPNITQSSELDGWNTIVDKHTTCDIWSLRRCLNVFLSTYK